MNVLKLENRIREYQHNEQIPGQHYPYFKVSKPENAISNNQQNRPNSRAKQAICERFQASKHDSWLSPNRSPFMTTLPKSKRFATLKTRFLTSKNQPPCGTAHHICERLADWKRDSWASANQLHCWTALPIFQRFVPWKRYSRVLANRHSCRMVLL